MISSWLLTDVALQANEDAQERKISFNKDIRPILSDACFQCHGPDDAKREGGLRLDQRSSATAAAESGSVAIVSGDVEKSELVKRLFSSDPSSVMPPPESGKSLSLEQKALLRNWILEGAEYEEHWSFRQVVRPEVPKVEGQSHPIDAFVEQKRREHGLKGSEPADRVTLIRRLTLDLHGVPPTPEEVEQFLADKADNAYERLVDRLLSSPRYGERMAVQWLDFARYADSNGFQVDSSRYQWPWRDWVIEAFNQNKPFDQFTIEQNAGDLIPNATDEQVLATGFHRNHKLNGEGGIIAEEWRVETVIDRVETMGLTWLGLTFNCCRCHDHKYDPISQKEFYQLFAYYNNVPESGTLQGESRNTEPVLQVSKAEHEAKISELTSEIKQRQRELNETESMLRVLASTWAKEHGDELLGNKPIWTLLTAPQVKSLQGAELKSVGDGVFLASGPNPAFDVYEITAGMSAGKISGVLLECFTDPSLPEQSLGRYSNGNFVLSRVEAMVQKGGSSESIDLKVIKGEADFSQNGWDIQNVVQQVAGKGWAVDGPTRKENRKAMFLFAEPVDLPPDSKLTIRLHHAAIQGHNIGKFRLSITGASPEAIRLDQVPTSPTLIDALRTAGESRNDSQWKEIENYYSTKVEGPLQVKKRGVEAAQKALNDYRGSLPTVMVMREGQPRESFILKRGQYDLRGDKVERGLPAALPTLAADQPNDRLGLARWLVDTRNPLTARVWVNRAWERFFGNGLVKSSENLGSQADFPSHAELLDYLAAEFMQPTCLPEVDGKTAHHWDMKALQKFIVMSDTYRQSAVVTADQLKLDPENRWLARAPRLRLQAEFIRDSVLSVSGLLVEKVGGPSVRPYMPDGVWDETSRYGDLRNYKPEMGENRYRRSMYTIWKRTAAPPTMLLFDAPNREICTVKRSRTNTPLQALSLLNEVTFIEAARGLAKRMISEGGADVRSRVQYGFRLALGREATAEELEVLVSGLETDRTDLGENQAAVDGLLNLGQPLVADGIERSELAAYTLAANVLLNLDEFVNRP